MTDPEKVIAYYDNPYNQSPQEQLENLASSNCKIIIIPDDETLFEMLES